MAKTKQQRFTARVAGTREHAKNASATKSGPGRFHSQGHQKASPPLARGRVRGNGRERAYVVLTRYFDSKRVQNPGKNKRGLGLV